MSRESLVEAYIAALPLTAVAIVSSADGRQKPSHAELVLSTIGVEGWKDQQPAAVAAQIERAAMNLGAPFQTTAGLQEAAAEAVAEIQNGGLARVNAEYKRYRAQQIAKAEKATPYAVFLHRFTASLVRNVVMTGRMI